MRDIDRLDVHELYGQIAAHIRSRFSKTIRDRELLTKEVLYGTRRFITEHHTAYGNRRKIAGLFNMTCYYEMGTYGSRLPGAFKYEEDVCVYKGDSEYVVRPGEIHTLRMIATASDYGEEDRIADIMIAAACNDTTYWNQWGPPLPLSHELISIAGNILPENGYGLWHPSTKHFVYQLPGDNFGSSRDMLIECLREEPHDAQKVADMICLQFGDFLNNPEVRCEVIHRNPGMMACFLYEYSAGEYLLSLKQAYEEGRLSKNEFVSRISFFDSDLRDQIKSQYKANYMGGELLPVIDRRIDELVRDVRGF